jgi:hypothetical protein
VAIEVETGISRKTEKDIMKKLNVLQKYDEWFIVTTNFEHQEYYSQYGETLTRINVKEKIDGYFQGDSSPESKTGSDSGFDSKSG